jgi:hypothetical protein
VVALFAPLLIIGVLAFVSANTGLIRTQPRPPLLDIPAGAVADQVRKAVRSATVPEQYRSLVDVRAFELAAAGGRPILWLTALVALAYAVTR